MDQNWYQDVKVFMEKFGQSIGKRPHFPSRELMQFRTDLVLEEFKELTDAIKAEDIVETADAFADVIYVLVGWAVAMGIPLDKVWAEVQRSNMAKDGGGKNESGKILKPAGWVPPDIEGALYNCRGCKDLGYYEHTTVSTKAEHHPACNGNFCVSECPVPVQIVESAQEPCHCGQHTTQQS